MNNDFVMMGNLFFMNLIPYLKFMHAICKYFNVNKSETRHQKEGTNDEREAKFIGKILHILTKKNIY